jgi:hypothetical protein
MVDDAWGYVHHAADPQMIWYSGYGLIRKDQMQGYRVAQEKDDN